MLNKLFKLTIMAYIAWIFIQSNAFPPVYAFFYGLIQPHLPVVESNSIDPAHLALPTNMPISVAMWQDHIEDAHDKYPTVPVAMIAGVITVESGGDPNAHSGSDGRGLMQVVPRFAGQDFCPNADLYDPVTNIDCGTQYLEWLLVYFNGDTNKAIMGFHGGHGHGANPRPIDQEYLRRVTAAMGSNVAVRPVAHAVGGGGTVSGSLIDKYYKGDYIMSQGAHMAGIYVAPNGASPSCFDYVGTSKNVYAPFDGTITASGGDGYCGLYGCNNSQLEISSNDGRYFYVLHGKYIVGQGDKVKEGQLIGTEDEIGNTKGVHSHVCVVE